MCARNTMGHKSSSKKIHNITQLMFFKGSFLKTNLSELLLCLFFILIYLYMFLRHSKELGCNMKPSSIEGICPIMSVFLQTVSVNDDVHDYFLLFLYMALCLGCIAPFFKYVDSQHPTSFSSCDFLKCLFLP